jgi:subtilisin-like proprotein convertase family protein
MNHLFSSASTVTDRRYIQVFAYFILGSMAQASTIWNGPTWNVSTAIPDNDDVGITDTRMVSIADIAGIESVALVLNVTSGWNGDLYAYLVHGSGFSVLLNRPGRSVAAPDGSATVDMIITFGDSAASDIHTAIPTSGGAVTGTYQPDGRITDPYFALNTDARPAMLSNFIGLNPNGTWTLFVADQSAGETSTLQSWSMTITGVPEPSAALLGGLGVLLLLRRRRSA